MQREAALDERAEQVAQQAAQLSQEKQQMTAVGVADHDVLDLNVGGTPLSAKRSTLTQVRLESIGIRNNTACCCIWQTAHARSMSCPERTACILRSTD